MALQTHGEIDYRDAAGRTRGREKFHVHVDAAGRRTLQANCEIDATRLVRHVVQTVDAQFRPIEAYVRVVRQEHECASGLVRFCADQVDIVATVVGGGIAHRCQELASAARAFGSHPLSIDGWMGALFDFSGPPRQTLPETWVSSYQFDGSGTVDCLPIRFGLDYRGLESVTTPAGTFDCHHFVYLLAGSAIDHPPYETWVTTDGSFTLVRARAGTPLDYTYELVALA